MSNNDLQNQLAFLKQENETLRKTELAYKQQIIDINSKLLERTKEIKCISDITEILGKAELSLFDVFNAVSGVLPEAMQFPSQASARIVFDGQVFGKEIDSEPIITISNEIVADSINRGFIDVFYSVEPQEEKKIFLEEERNLLISVTHKIGQYLERKAREEDIRKTEERFRNLIEKMNDIFLDFDAHANIIYASSSVKKVLGYDAKDLLGKSLFSLFGFTENEKEDFLKILSSKGKFESVFEISKKNESKCWLQASLSANLTGDKFTGGHCRLIDITEKRKVELELLESESMYRSILAASPDVITICDLSGRILFTSPKVIEMFGYERPDSLIDTSILEYLDPYCHEKAMTGIGAMVERKMIGAEEYTGIKADGSLFDIEINGEFIYDAEGLPYRMIFVIRDISNRKKTEQQLQKTEALFKEMVESINDVIYEVKIDGTIVYVSPAIKSILGYDADDLIGENFFRYMYPEDISRVAETFSALVTDKLPYLEYRYFTKDGQIKWVRTSTTPIIENNVLAGGRGSMNDIHELKMAEMAVRENESKFRGLFTSASVGMVMLDQEGNVLLNNDKFTKATGYTSEDINHISQWWQFAFPDKEYRKQVIAEWNSETERYLSNPNDAFNPYEAQIRCKDGNDRYFEISFATTGTSNLITFVDVTERRLANDSLKSQKEYIHSIVNAIPDLMFVISAEGVILEFHSGNDKDLAMPPEVFLNKNVNDVFPLNVSIGFFEGLKAIQENNESIPFVYELAAGNKLKDFEVRFSPLGSDKIIALVSNVTQRVQSEKLIRKSEEKLKIIANNTYHWEFWQGPDGKPLYHSPSSEKITGIPFSQLMDNFNWMDNLIHPDDKESYAEHHKDSRGNRKPGFHHFRIIKNNGEIRHIDHVCQPVFDEGNNYIGIRGSNVDVTQRVEAEKELTESNRKINVLMNNLKGVAYRCNNDKAWTMDFISNGITVLTGYDADDFINNKVRDFNSVIFEEDRDKVWLEIQKGIAKNEAYAFDYRIITADGTQKWVWERGQGVFENGELIALEGFISDISEKKLTENALMESEEKYRLIAENTSDGIFVINENNVLDYASPAYRKQMGFDPEGELSLNQESIYNIIHPDERDQVFKTIFEAIAAQKESLTFSYRALHHQKKEYQWLEDKVRFTYNDEGKLLFTQGISRDISERKKAEAAIKLSEEKYRSLIESSDSYIVMLDSDGNYLFLNNIAALPFEMQPDAMVGMNVKQLFPPDQAELVLHDIARILETNEGFIKEVFVHLAGKETWFRVSVQPVRNESGKAIAVLMYSTNITESKLSEERIKQSEKKYKVLFNDSPDPYLIIRDGKFIECNKAVELLLKADSSEIIGKNLAEISPEFQPDGRKSTLLVAELLKKTFEDGYTSFEWVHLRMDGTEVLVQVNLTAIEYDGETVLFSTWQDMTEKRAAEEKLRKLSRAVEQSPVSIVITSVNGEIEYANPIACETTGYSLEELIGKNPRVLKSGETTHDEYSKLWNSISVGKEWKGIFHNKKKNGELYWESSTIAPILDAEGNITHYVALIEDITERREMQLALQESQERFAQIAEQSQTVIWEVDQNGLYIYVSHVAEKVWGYSPSELVGKMHYYDLHPAEHREAYKKAASDLLTNMVTLRDFENPIQRKDGSIIWVSTNGIPVTNHLNEFVGYRGADINITERKLAEEELRKFRTISDQANYGTAIANLDGTLAYVNEAFAAMHGWEISELIGKSLAVLHTPEQMESVAPLLGLIQTQGGFSAEEVWRVKKDGTVFPSLMNTKLILDQNNQPQFMATSATDITELVKTNQELLIAKDKAEASDRLKTAFMQNISHEVRTPLNGILGFGAMLADPYLDAEEKQEFLPMFEFSSNRLIKTITDYMDISLIASGSMEMNKKEVKLNSELFELRSKYEALCLSKSIDLYFKIDETQNDFTLHIDPEFLKKILSHLLDNAVTFTKEGSIVVSHAINADSIVFFVRDTGVGIAQDALERVFESFMQEDISTTRGHEGSGLGLFIVKGLLNQLGGNIELESTKGEGTTVSITIPVEQKKPQPVIQEKVKPVDKFTSNKAILVAEDDHSNQFFIRVILKKQGFKVYTAFDGKEALDICRTNPEISLVLMDLKMPVMNGYEATPKIKALRKDINIIAVTSHAMSGDERLALKAGCDDYLSKPVKVDALMNKLKKFGFVSEK